MSSSPALSGKTALVTGSAKRVGAEVARALHAEGANVVIHYRRSRAAAEAIEAELNAIRSGSATLAAADIRKPAELDGL
ncbi:MAG TPA: SDR family NAD(P)-dependent oxidoreductase, partial [Steroidobacteraceae bacterium]|nr:SDR family NAD(P)-dependent oxidoreductase [Steroidobacteraceae bacterium]